MEELIKIAEEAINYSFKRKELLYQAFIRRSYSNENMISYNNEILELIGDRALDLAVTSFLCNYYNASKENAYMVSKSEGEITRLKARLVCKENLAKRMDILGLNKYLMVGYEDIKENIINEPSVKEDLFEAIIGSVTIDSNYDNNIIYGVMLTMLNPLMIIRGEIDYLKRLKEYAKRGNAKIAIGYKAINDKIIAKIKYPVIDPYELMDNSIINTRYDSYLAIANTKELAKLEGFRHIYNELNNRGYIGYIFKEEKIEEVGRIIDEYNLNITASNASYSAFNKLITKDLFIKKPRLEQYKSTDGYWECEIEIGGFPPIKGSGNTKKEAKEEAISSLLRIIDDNLMEENSYLPDYSDYLYY